MMFDKDSVYCGRTKGLVKRQEGGFRDAGDIVFYISYMDVLLYDNTLSTCNLCNFLRY